MFTAKKNTLGKWAHILAQDWESWGFHHNDFKIVIMIELTESRVIFILKIKKK